MYRWFKIFNLVDFEALGLVSRTYVLDLEGIGQKSILVTKGRTVGVLYDDVFLSLDINGANPFKFEGHALYKADNNDVFIGIEVVS